MRLPYVSKLFSVQTSNENLNQVAGLNHLMIAKTADKF